MTFLNQTANQAKSQTELEQKIERELETIGLNLVQFQKFQNGDYPTLRITINDPCKPVGHEQCAKATKLIHKLDPNLSEKYHLEVWSPGIGRELKTQRDFEIFKAKKVELIFLDSKTKPVIGNLLGKFENLIKLQILDPNADNISFLEECFDESLISKVQLAHDEVLSQNNPVEISLEDV
ncbi:MAG: hypothetical protein SFU25_04855 [Candidatus Caenarcaniphilales bacterium]|nr:hypothetical protein [Candidatus Caenarcaniphilales bacterium]